MKAVALLVALALAVVGCNGDGDGAQPASTSTIVTSAPPTSATGPAGSTTTRPASPVPEAGASLEPNGRYFGYIRAIDVSDDPPTLDFDVAEFLTGGEADQAAGEAGEIAPGEEVPNDYFLRNRSSSVRTLPVREDVVVTRVQCPTFCEDHVPGEWAGLVESFQNPDPQGFTYADPYRGADSQYWITLENGAVAVIDEQYLP